MGDEFSEWISLTGADKTLTDHVQRHCHNGEFTCQVRLEATTLQQFWLVPNLLFDSFALSSLSYPVLVLLVAYLIFDLRALDFTVWPHLRQFLSFLVAPFLRRRAHVPVLL